MKTEVIEQINKQNNWYVGSQFNWARRKYIVRIYQKRVEYFNSIITKYKPDQEKITLLDWGCGDGYWVHRLSENKRLKITGIDYNPLRIERAQQNCPGAQIIEADINEYYPEEKFDILLFNQVIEHIEDDISALEKAKSLIKEDGILILGTPNEGSRLHQFRNRMKGKKFNTDHVHFYTEKEIVKKIQLAGFKINSVMREVFIVGNDRVYYYLTGRNWGFNLLEYLAKKFPGECSDFYFECQPH